MTWEELKEKAKEMGADFGISGHGIDLISLDGFFYLANGEVISTKVDYSSMLDCMIYFKKNKVVKNI